MPITPTIVDNHWKKKRTKKKPNFSLTSIFSHSFEFKFRIPFLFFLSFWFDLPEEEGGKKNSIKEFFGVFPHCPISLLGSFQFIVCLFVFFQNLLFTPPILHCLFPLFSLQYTLNSFFVPVTLRIYNHVFLF